MAIFFSCCPWQNSHHLRVAPAPLVLEQHQQQQQHRHHQQQTTTTADNVFDKIRQQTNKTTTAVSIQTTSYKVDHPTLSTTTTTAARTTTTIATSGEGVGKNSVSKVNNIHPQNAPAAIISNAIMENRGLVSIVEESSVNSSTESNFTMTGHCFKRKTFHKPTYCHHCSDLLWGLTNQGLHCSVCGYVTHERCQAQVVTACTIKAASLVQVPKLHTLVELISERKRFCNVCRRKIDDQCSYKCDVCPYYVHDSCRQLIVNNCKLTATASSNTKILKVKHQHHWTEGHLPVNSKCAVCGKACSSTDCLTGLRCSWCLTTVHSFCVNSVGVSCDFGVLRGTVLPPYVVKDFNPNTWTSNGKLLNDDDRDERPEPVCNDEDCFILRIHEGPLETPHCWRNFLINRTSTTADVLKEAYQKFRIKEDKSKYYLTRANGSSVEKRLNDTDNLWTKLDKSDTTLKQVFLRHVKLDTKQLRIVLYAGAINSLVQSVKLKVNIMAEAREIIRMAMQQFQLEEEDPSKFCITQMKVTKNKVKETYISDDDSLYKVLVEKRKQTIAELHSTRFYLQMKEVQSSAVSLYVGNLPTELTLYQYKYMLGDCIGKWDEQFMTMEAVFSCQGAVVVHFKSIECFLRNVASLTSAQIEGKCLSLRILPEIKTDLLPGGYCPLIVFVNSKSGGGQGAKLLTTFKRLLNPYQVADLLDGGPLPLLYMFRNVELFRVLICGGDGTFGWVLSSLEEIRYNVLKCNRPASALLPLGTGNDLARILNWGSGYQSESLLNILKTVSCAAEVMLDRWNVVFDASTAPSEHKDHQLKQQQPTVNGDLKCDDSIQIFAMNNYFSIGIDAQICLQFHMSREENPEKFNNRLRNKGLYFKESLKNLNRSSMSNIQERLHLEVDGQTISLPSIEGIAITNISSWGAGADPWGKDRDERFEAPSYSDGILEVIGFTGVYHMGKIKGGLSTGLRLAQGAQINLTLKDDLPVQVDGEPWLQPACRVMVRPCLQQAKMLAKVDQVRSMSNVTELRTQQHGGDIRRNTCAGVSGSNFYTDNT